MAGTRIESVDIELKTVILDQGEKEEMIIKQKGRYFLKDGTVIILFDEEDENGEMIQTMITMQSKRAVLKRSGKIRMNQLFKPDQKTESVYHHPFGNMLMETYTEQLTFTEEDRQGYLSIEYQLSLNGQEPRKHQLMFTYKKEV